jgi:hypothetical protein
MPNITLPLPDPLFDAVDKARGEIPRTVWIRGAIEGRLRIEEGIEPLAVFTAVPDPDTDTTGNAPIVAEVPDSTIVLNPPPPMSKPKVTAELVGGSITAIEETPERVAPATCPHKWRSPQGRCFACGDTK